VVSSGAHRRAIVFLILATVILWFPVARAFMGRTSTPARPGLHSGPGGTPVAWIVGVLVAFSYSAFAVINIPLVPEHCCALSLTKILAVAAVAAAIVEEAFFRRLVMDALSASGVRPRGRFSRRVSCSASLTASGELQRGESRLGSRRRHGNLRD
jgi:hypothetical protein